MAFEAMEDDYALFTTLGLFGLYAVSVVMTPREERSWVRTIIALLVAILFYTVSKHALKTFGFQPR